jgi:hypothetical protein
MLIENINVERQYSNISFKMPKVKNKIIDINFTKIVG